MKKIAVTNRSRQARMMRRRSSSNWSSRYRPRLMVVRQEKTGNTISRHCSSRQRARVIWRPMTTTVTAEMAEHTDMGRKRGIRAMAIRA